MSHDHGEMDMSSPTASPGSSDGMSGMQMTLYFGKNAEILFSGWNTDNSVEYFFSLLAIFFIAVFHEWLSTFRADMVSTVLASKQANDLKKPFFLHRILLTSLFAINAVTGYALMLMIMTYNAGIVIVVIVGLTISNFIFKTYRDSPDQPSRVEPTSHHI